MGALLEYFTGLPRFVEVFQILLDLGLIGFVAFLILKRPRHYQAVEDLAKDLGRIVEETKTISTYFDTNLQERQKIIQQLLSKLDQKLAEAERMCQRLESLSRKPPVQPEAGFASRSVRQSDNQEILRLAQRGLDAAAIAKRLQKPVGEVELILNLQRISPNRP